MQLNKLSSDSLAYSVLNAVGAGLIVVSLLFAFHLSALLMEVFWVLIGFVLFGPDALVSGVAAQDLGGTAAAGTAAGMINGIGSIGAVLQGLVTAFVAQRYGWDAMFVVFGGLSMVAAVAAYVRGQTAARVSSSSRNERQRPL